eukprot:1041097_1
MSRLSLGEGTGDDAAQDGADLNIDCLSPMQQMAQQGSFYGQPQPRNPQQFQQKRQPPPPHGPHPVGPKPKKKKKKKPPQGNPYGGADLGGGGGDYSLSAPKPR